MRVTAPALQDQEYTITDFMKSYEIPDFTPSVAGCPVRYSFRLGTVLIEDIVTFKNDNGQKTFEFFEKDSVERSGHGTRSYNIWVYGEAGKSSWGRASANFKLKLINPCTDPNFVQINVDTVASPQYHNIFAGEKKQPIVTLGYPTYTTYPIEHELCGERKMIAWFNGVRFYDTPGVSQRTWPYFPRDITVNKDSFEFVGTHEVLIQVFFRYQKKWQVVDIPFDLIIPDPCDPPVCVADEEENCGQTSK